MNYLKFTVYGINQWLTFEDTLAKTCHDAPHSLHDPESVLWWCSLRWSLGCIYDWLGTVYCIADGLCPASRSKSWAAWELQ